MVSNLQSSCLSGARVTGTCHDTQLVLDLHWLSASTCKSFAHYVECHQPVHFLRGTHNPSIYTQAMTFGPGDRENWVEGQYMQHSAEDSRYRLLRVLILWVIGGALYFQATCMTTRERWGPRGGSLTKHPGILLEADSMTNLCLAYSKKKSQTDGRKTALSIKHIVFINSLGSVSCSSLRGVGMHSNAKSPDACQGPDL